MLNEINQTEKDKYCVISLYVESTRRKNPNKLIERDQTCSCERKKWRWGEWEEDSQRKGLPSFLSSKEPTCQCRKHRFNSWVETIPWRRKWHPPPVFLPWKFHRQRTLAGYSPWGHKESDTTEQLNHQPPPCSVYAQTLFCWWWTIKVFNERVRQLICI